jgi:hypothetical protein
LICVTPPRALTAIAFACTVFFACSGHGPAADQSGDGFGAGFQGDGIQCGAIVCSGSQQCCYVAIAIDAASGTPTHKCDQGCESICMDECPDAGNGMGGMGGMPGMGPAPMGMPEAGMGGMGGMGMPDGGAPPHGGPAAADAGAHP